MIKEKLEAYRRQKRKEEIRHSIKNAVTNMLTFGNRMNVEKFVQPEMDEKVKLCEEEVDVARSTSPTSDSSSTTEEVTLASQSTVLTKCIYILYFLMWLTFYLIALEYEFGAVYFVLSALVFICVNTRSGPKRKDEPSAYSVFNPNCQAIEGTLDASQLESEIRGGLGRML